MTEQEIITIVNEINTLRKNNKNNWYFYSNEQIGIKLKGYNTWIQRIEYNGYVMGSPMEMSAKEFKAWLTNLLTN